MPLDHLVTLGRSGLAVSPFGLGTMTFGEEWGWGASPAESEAMLDRYVGAGGNFIDTADIYTHGHSESILGAWLAARPDRRRRVVLATKFCGNLHPGNANTGGASRRALVSACDASLARLRTDAIDLYWLHCQDALTPIEETLRALDDLVRAGKVRYLGLSDVPAWVAAQAQVTAAFRGWAPLVALQFEYSLLERTAEGELLPMARELGFGGVPWSPLRSGVLAGHYQRAEAKQVQPGRGDWVKQHLTEHAFDVLDVVRRVARERDSTPARVALAWVRGRPGIASTLIGARSARQLEDNLAALDLALTPDQRAALDDASRPRLNFPADFLAGTGAFMRGGSTVNGTTWPVFPLAPPPTGGRA